MNGIYSVKLKPFQQLLKAFRPLQNFDVSTVSLYHLTLQRMPIAHILVYEHFVFYLRLSFTQKASIKYNTVLIYIGIYIRFYLHLH